MATLTKSSKRSGAKRSSSRTTSRATAKTGRASRAPRTARPGEPAAAQTARLDRIAAERRIEEKIRTASQHSEHPETPADSTVRHAEPQTGKQSGEGAGGFPQGEYDVIPPAKATAAAPATEGITASDAADTSNDALIAAHLGDKDIEVLQQQLGENRRLDDAEVPLILEALPVGAIIEHEAPNRWRVRSPASGGIRWGHGATAVHAIEAYVLGDTASSAEDAAARAFNALDPATQQAIRERDQKAAERVGGSDVNAFARDEARKAAAADRTAAAPAANAITDGPEKASARAEQGSRGAQNTPESSARRSASKTASKSAAKKGAAKSGSKRSGSRRR